MRSSFVHALTEVANSDDGVTLLTGDLGFRVVEEFESAHPGRFLNCGVAEQAMMSIAAGMAFSGFKVFAYSIVNFATFRALEQIRNDICYHHLPVCVVSVGAGTMYGTLGYSHHGLEDLAVMRALPGMRIYSPADDSEVRSAVADIVSRGGPSYLRLGRAPAVAVHKSEVDVSAGVLEVRSGADLTVLATGSMVSVAAAASDQLRAEGIAVQVTSVPVVEPLATDFILAHSASGRFMTIEDHVSTGGLGTALLEGLAGRNMGIDVTCVGFPRGPLVANGSAGYLLDSVGMSVDGLKQRMREACRA